MVPTVPAVDAVPALRAGLGNTLRQSTPCTRPATVANVPTTRTHPPSVSPLSRNPRAPRRAYMPTAPPPITRAIFPPAPPASEAIREPPSVSAPDPVPAAPQDPTWFTDKRRLPEPSREISPPTLLNPRQRREPSSACRGDRPSDGIMCLDLSLIHISEPTRLRRISYAVFCLKKKK